MAGEKKTTSGAAPGTIHDCTVVGSNTSRIMSWPNALIRVLSYLIHERAYSFGFPHYSVDTLLSSGPTDPSLSQSCSELVPFASTNRPAKEEILAFSPELCTRLFPDRTRTLCGNRRDVCQRPFSQIGS